MLGLLYCRMGVLYVLGGMSFLSIIWIYMGLHNHILRLEKSVDIIRSEYLSKLHQDQPYSDDDLVVIYNRVPKTGSTSFVGVVYQLCRENKINVLHINITKNYHFLSLSDQINFVRNVTEWTDKKPAFYHGHMAYLDFARLGVTAKPLYINLVRDPLERLISYYYFLRNGDDFRPHVKRAKAGNVETFVDCIRNNSEGCQPENLWLQIPFFCGQAAECWEVGSEHALEMAKYNLINNYLVVGLTEDMADFVAVLEAVLPRFFAGATDLYNHGNRSHLRRTSNKVQPSEEYKSILQKSDIWRMENEFYEFARSQFDFVKKQVLTFESDRPQKNTVNFFYEKIRPR